MKEQELFNDGWLRLRAPTPLIVLADEHARRLDMSLAAFTRAALVLALEAQGVCPPRVTKPRHRRIESHDEMQLPSAMDHIERV